MKNRQLINLLESVLGGAKHSGNESTFSCPYCNHHKKKLVINTIKIKSVSSAGKYVSDFENKFKKFVKRPIFCFNIP